MTRQATILYIYYIYYFVIQTIKDSDKLALISKQQLFAALSGFRANFNFLLVIVCHPTPLVHDLIVVYCRDYMEHLLNIICPFSVGVRAVVGSRAFSIASQPKFLLLAFQLRVKFFFFFVLIKYKWKTNLSEEFNKFMHKWDTQVIKEYK